METMYHDMINPEGLPITSFVITTKKGHITGLYNKKDNRIYVHSAMAQKGLKGLMDIVTRKFKTNLVTFTPLITDGIPNTIRGEIKTLPADAPNNPYGEDFQYMECVWKPTDMQGTARE